MDIRVDRQARLELAGAVRGRYQAASGAEDPRRVHRDYGLSREIRDPRLNADPDLQLLRPRVRAPLYDEAIRAALIVLWEASDRLCGKRLQPLMPILLPALERNEHLKLHETIREKLLAMSAATVDRPLRVPRSASQSKRPRRIEPAPKRRIRMRTFADWNEPVPGCMEMDLVAHCGTVNRGSYVHNLTLTDIASGWTECAALVVREGGLAVETLDRIWLGLPFRLQEVAVDNSTEFVNDKLIGSS